jgi:nucleotide-binding universal stress UspA family protein
MKIVAATDFSTRSQRALRRAGLIARAADADLTLVHVIDDDRPAAHVERESAEASRYLDELVQSIAELRDVRCRAVTAFGEPFDGLLHAADSVAADLIVMGAHRKQLLRDIFVGTTIERVIRTGSYPVLMVNAPPEQAYQKTIAAVDMSEPSAHAVRTARNLGFTENASITYVHGFHALVRGQMLRSDIARERIEQYAAEELGAASAEVTAFLDANGLNTGRWSLRVKELRPLDAIEDAVRALQPDLVMIGTRGRSGLLKVLLGSVTEEVLRTIDVDILAVPPIRA